MNEIKQKLSEDYFFIIEEVLKEAFELVKRNLTPLLFYTSIYLLINIFLVKFGYRGMIIQILLSGPFIAGYYNGFRLDYYKVEPSILNYFIIFQAPLNYLFANILVGILTAAGVYLLIVPGIYLFIAYFFTIPFLINRPLNIWQAMEASRLIITKKWLQFLSLILILLSINVLGALLFGLGLLVTIPFTYAAIHIVFFKIFPIEELDENEHNTNNDTINLNMFR